MKQKPIPVLFKKKKKSQSKENDETFLRYPINYNKSDIKT